MNGGRGHTLTIPSWAQGRPGFGQGGYSAAQLEAAVGRPLMVSFRRPIPLERSLAVAETTPPEWVGDDTGGVDDAVVWTVMDCAQAFHVGYQPTKRTAVTGRYTVELLGPVLVGERYAVVAFDGHWSGGWQGRKRGAAAVVFDGDGEPVARSDSLWIAADARPGASPPALR